MKKINGSTRRRKRQEWAKFVNKSMRVQNERKVWSYLYLPKSSGNIVEDTEKQGDEDVSGQEV